MKLSFFPNTTALLSVSRLTSQTQRTHKFCKNEKKIRTSFHITIARNAQNFCEEFQVQSN